MGSCGSQTTFNNGRAVIAAADEVREQLLDAAAEQLEAARDDLELVDGAVRVKGSPDKSVTIAELAARRRRSTGKGSGDVPDAPAGDPAAGCVGRLGIESFLAPQLITHAARVKVDRETGVVRVLQVAAAHDCGRILNRIGADGQVYGGVVMGIGQALTEGTQLDDARPPAQPAPARLQARDRLRRARRSTSTGSRPTRRTPGRRARRASASRRACRRRARSRTRSRR